MESLQWALKLNPQFYFTVNCAMEFLIQHPRRQARVGRNVGSCRKFEYFLFPKQLLEKCCQRDSCESTTDLFATTSFPAWKEWRWDEFQLVKVSSSYCDRNTSHEDFVISCGCIQGELPSCDWRPTHTRIREENKKFWVWNDKHLVPGLLKQFLLVSSMKIYVGLTV